MKVRIGANEEIEALVEEGVDDDVEAPEGFIRWPKLGEGGLCWGCFDASNDSDVGLEVGPPELVSEGDHALGEEVGEEGFEPVLGIVVWMSGIKEEHICGGVKKGIMDNNNFNLKNGGLA